MTEEEKKKSRMDKLKERVSGRYPNDTFETDDDYVGRFSDDYDAMEADYNKTKSDLEAANKMNEQIDKLFNSDRRSARFVMDWASGKDPLVELYKRYGDEAVEVLQDPERLEEFKKEREAYLKEITDGEAASQSILDAVEKSMDAIDALEESGEMSKEDIDRALEKYKDMATKYLKGEFGEEELRSVLLMLDHDKHVEEAGAAGELKGKNAKMTEKLRKPTPGDGMPDLDGGGNLPQNDREAPDLGALNRFEGEPDIFARGGERRTVRR